MSNTIQYPLVSVISINYNHADVTMQMIESLRKITYPAIEIIIVDNASTNDHPQKIKEQYPWINLIISNVNLGFAGGNNLGLLQAKGKYVLFLNNDTEVDEGFLEPLVQLLKQDRKIGLVSPKVLFYQNPDILQYAGFTKLSNILVRNFAIGFGEKDTGQFQNAQETGSVFGAAMLVPMDVIQQVGVMDPVFFLYYEEHDWANRIRAAGYKLFYHGGSKVFHKESISTVKNSPLQIYYLLRNRVLYSRRNNTGIRLLASLLYLYLVPCSKHAMMFILKGRFDLFAATIRAFWWNLSTYRNIRSKPFITDKTALVWK